MGELAAGSATREITPDVATAVPLRGYTAPGDRIATDVHDPLFARALAVSDGECRVGIAAVDAIGVPEAVRQRVRAALVESGPELDALVVAASHTHAGPFVPLEPLDSIQRFDISGHTGAVDAAVERIERGLVGSIRAAVETLEPATVRVGRAENDRTAVNRRREWGTDIAGTRADSGPLDPELLAAEFETSSGERTVLFNYACHPVCSTRYQTAVSADWPGRVSERLRDERGATTLFLNGAAGDVNPRDRYPETTNDDAVYEYLAAVGDEVAETVLRALADSECLSDGRNVRVDARRRELTLPVKSLPPREAIEDRLGELEARRDRLEEADLTESSIDRQARRHLQRWLGLLDWGHERLSASLTHVEIGAFGVLAVPAEPLTAHGLAFKDGSEKPLAVAGYANGNLGYLPPLSELENGGYEVRMCPLSPDGIRLIRDCGLELVA